MERSRQLQRFGWLCFKLMWLPFATMFIGMIGMPDGEYAWAELPALTRYSLIAMGFCFAGTFIGLIGAQVARASASRRIRTHGRPANATIMKVWDTGTTINQQPVIGLRLTVQPSALPSFEAETVQLVSRLQMGLLQPGVQVRVRYLPESREVALALEEETASSSAKAILQ